MKYIPALDGIRALAILLVLLFHWFPVDHWVNVLPNGPIGVTLFFVLSGYLISNILMGQQAAGTFLPSFKNFVIRRALRIFPIYFLVLLGLLVGKKIGIQVVTNFYEHPVYYWTYFYNHWLEQTQNWSDMLSPYWSLSVEEQFYIVWPFFMLLIPSGKRLLGFLWSVVVLGIIARYILVYKLDGIGVYMITCVDTFAWGALLAYYLRNGRSAELGIWIGRLWIPVLILWIILCVMHTDADLVKQLFFRSLTSMVSVALLFQAMQEGILARIFSWTPLRKLGQMSYGVYLYHMLVPDLVYQLASRLHIPLPEDPYHVIGILGLFLIAAISYRWIEKPIQELKRFFV
jgi:peptidoglycan/LPS O-acetylase OafA/YrhL